MKTIEELAQQIHDWEVEAGESFTDYFMHSSVRDVSWAFWLLGKGFSERANEILNEVEAGNTCLDQELLYEIYPSSVYENGRDSWNKENYYKNVLLWSEFFLATEIYTKRVEEFFTNYPD